MSHSGILRAHDCSEKPIKRPGSEDRCTGLPEKYVAAVLARPMCGGYN